MEIDEKLRHHPDLDAGDIEVTVDQSEVLLSGTVCSDEARRLAERIAGGVAGVRCVRNELSAEKG